MALEPDPKLYLAYLRANESTFTTESKIRLAAERGISADARRVRALHDWSAWQNNRPISLTPFLPAGSLKTLTIYAGVASLRGTTKYLVAYGEWATNYGRMQQIPLRLKGITAIRIDSDPKFRAGAQWVCVHTRRCVYFLLQPAVAQTTLWNDAIPLWESTSNDPGLKLGYEDVDCNRPRPAGWLGLRSWKSWRRWCKETDNRTVIPGNEGRREGDLQDDCDPEDEPDESEHSYEESDEYAGEDDESELPKRGSSRQNLVRRPRKNPRSAESHGKGKAPSEPRRTRLSVKQGGGDDPATLATFKSSTPAEQPNERVGGVPCEDDRHGWTAQVEGRSGTSDEDHQPAGPRKRTRLTMDEMMNVTPSQPLNPVHTCEIAPPAEVPPVDPSVTLPPLQFEHNGPATHLPGLRTIERPAGSQGSFVSATATTITPFNPMPPPAPSGQGLSDSLADMARENGAPGTELQILAQLFSQPSTSMLRPPFFHPFRDRTPPASQITSGGSSDRPPLEEEVEAPDGNWFASQERSASFNLDLSNLWPDNAAGPSIVPPAAHVDIPEDVYWDDDLRPAIEFAPHDNPGQY